MAAWYLTPYVPLVVRSCRRARAERRPLRQSARSLHALV